MLLERSKVVLTYIHHIHPVWAGRHQGLLPSVSVSMLQSAEVQP